MGRFIDLTGQKYGRLIVVGYAGVDRQGAAKWHCRCECGGEKDVVGAELKRGRTVSCGCYHKEKQVEITTKYGYSTSRIAYIWRSMLHRCNNEKDESFPVYGGRGIRVCKEWETDIEAFRGWAEANGYADNLTLDRIDPNGNYEPSNCRWVTMKTQQNNRRNNLLLTHNGQTHTASEWAEITGISYSVIKARYRDGWSAERTLTEPVKHYKTDGHM